MGQKKKPPKRNVTETSRNLYDLYLGCFTHREAGEPDYEGSFQIVLEATSPENAVQGFKKLLRRLRDRSSLFDQPTIIYLESIIQLCGSFKNGLLVNLESGPVEGITSKIACAIPDQDDHEARAYEWQADDPEDEGFVEPFLDFGGRAAFKARAEADSPAPIQTPEIAWQRDREEKARKEKEETEKRKAVLYATLAELEGRSQPPSKRQSTSARKPKKRSRSAGK